MTSTPYDLTTFTKQTTSLRNAFVLRQWDHVGYHAYKYLHDYIINESTLPTKQLNSIEEDNITLDHEKLPPSTIDITMPYPIPMYRLFPHHMINFEATNGKHLSHRSNPLQDDHPAIMCVGYIIAAIQNLGYLPITAKPTAEFKSQHTTFISKLSPQQQQSYTIYQIATFLCNTYGTWINITPSILLQCLQYFFPISPFFTYLISSHCLNAISHDGITSTQQSKYKKQSTKGGFAIKNIRFRRQLYVYLIQSIIIASRLRFHTLYAPDAYPLSILESRELITDEIRENKKFIQIYVDLSVQQQNIILEQMEQYTVTEESVGNVGDEKSIEYPYVPYHIFQHIKSIANSIDHNQDMFEFSNYQPYELLRIYITGIVSLDPSQLSSTTSISFVTKPQPPPKPIQDELDTQIDYDNNNDDDDDQNQVQLMRLVVQQMMMEGRSEDEINEVLEQVRRITRSEKQQQNKIPLITTKTNPTTNSTTSNSNQLTHKQDGYNDINTDDEEDIDIMINTQQQKLQKGNKLSSLDDIDTDDENDPLDSVITTNINDTTHIQSNDVKNEAQSLLNTNTNNNILLYPIALGIGALACVAGWFYTNQDNKQKS